MRSFVPAIVICCIVAAFGCKKIEEKVLLKGIFQLNSFYLDTISTNFMSTALTGYDNPAGCCKYLIDFQDDGEAFGFYYRNDTLHYIVRGEWELQERHKLYINLDKYVNGVFDVDRQGKKEFQLTTDSNTVEIGSLKLVRRTEMNITRE